MNDPGVRVEPNSTHRDLENGLIVARVHVDPKRADLSRFRTLVDVKGSAMALFAPAAESATNVRPAGEVTFLLLHPFDVD